MANAWGVFLANKIYYVTTPATSDGQNLRQDRSELDIVEAFLRGGGRVVQYRPKHDITKAIPASILDQAIKIRALTADYGAVLIVNDDPQLAREVDADGVHLGMEDMPACEAREVLGGDGVGIIGKSTHNEAEIRAATTEGVDYINIGPLFPTKTKQNTYPPIIASKEDLPKSAKQLDKLIALAKGLQLPFTVMGGIQANDIAWLFSKGVRHIAMISGISKAKNIESHVRAMTSQMTFS